ncbi:nuclear transport factor 2 family protein [Microbulbifer sp. SAOS-129_SWC]|uniref:YybH family protein n=1 Tax=Microbulbifer sp. SAOS-129_SWC TaxID=3145235 RepID=UPI003216608F
MKKRLRNSLGLLLLAAVTLPMFAAAHGSNEHAPRDPALFSGLDTGAGRAVREFHRALNGGDRDAVLKALAKKVVILEGGGVERSQSEYAGHHLQADIDFLKKMQVTQLELQVREVGNLAYAFGRTRMEGKYKDKTLDLQSMETLVLQRDGDDWKIVQIHWSSK